jgi:hypothetical protein
MVFEEKGKMVVSEKKTGRQQYSGEQKIFAIAAMLACNRQFCESTAQTSRGRDSQGRFCTSGHGPGRPSLNSIVREIATQNKISESTIFNWYRLYRSFGAGALIRKCRAGKGVSTILLRTPELRRMIDARLSSGMNPFAAFKSLLWVRGLHAPSYNFVLRYARGTYRPDGESSAGGRPESTAL